MLTFGLPQINSLSDFTRTTPKPRDVHSKAPGRAEGTEICGATGANAAGTHSRRSAEASRRSDDCCAGPPAVPQKRGASSTKTKKKRAVTKGGYAQELFGGDTQDSKERSTRCPTE